MSTHPTAQKRDTSGMDLGAALPEWRQALWHDISIAARARNAFNNNEYDANGDLNPCSARFAELCTWLSARRTGTQFETLKPTWRYVADSRWEPTFYAVECMESAAGVKKQIHRKTTGILFDGLASADHIREDWVLVRSDKVPGREELSEEGRYCYIM